MSTESWKKENSRNLQQNLLKMELDKYRDIQTFFSSPTNSAGAEQECEYAEHRNNECADIDKATGNESPIIMD